MVRNAGGRVFDAIRTLATLQTIGAPGAIVVMHHTGKSFPQAPPTICSEPSLPLQSSRLTFAAFNETEV